MPLRPRETDVEIEVCFRSALLEVGRGADDDVVLAKQQGLFINGAVGLQVIFGALATGVAAATELYQSFNLRTQVSRVR
jgi:hypothetical protein